MLKNIRFIPAVEMTNLPNATFYDSINIYFFFVKKLNNVASFDPVDLKSYI